MRSLDLLTGEHDPKLWSVSQLNRCVATVLAEAFVPLWVEGEISNLSCAASGHWYFVLKDADAQLRCVMYRQRALRVEGRIQNGAQVELYGAIGLYTPRGEFQLSVEQLRAAGQGASLLAVEQLKARLAAEGLFEEARKRPLPIGPRAVGIVTSLKAAALHDVLTTFKRRAPGIKIIVYPALVQGEGAAVSLKSAVVAAAERREVDVLLICRGGGSVEDLAAFNDEALVRALFACAIPTVSGVGHETDVTLVDWVVDQRAATPTAAAELCSPDTAALKRQLQQLARGSLQGTLRYLGHRSQQLDELYRRLAASIIRIPQLASQLSPLQRRLGCSAQTAMARSQQLFGYGNRRLWARVPHFSEERARWQIARVQLGRTAEQHIRQARRAVEALHLRLFALDPAAVLKRGYSWVVNLAGQPVHTVRQLQVGESLQLQLHDGLLAVQIEAIQPLRPSPIAGRTGNAKTD